MIANLSVFCKQFYEATGIPIRYVEIPTNHYESFPTLLDDADIFRMLPDGFSTFKWNPDYFISPSFSYYGFTMNQSDDTVIIIGPIYSTPVSDATVHAFMKEWSIHPDHFDQMQEFLRNIPSLSFNRFLQTLTFLHLCLTDEAIDSGKHFHLTDEDPTEHLNRAHSARLVDAREQEQYHNTWQFERLLQQHIQDGNTQQVRTLLTSAGTNLSEGRVADNSLRQMKNIFITTATLATRSAVAGGMDVDQAYQLSDVYIQECERSSDISHIAQLTYTMLIDFTERVAKNKIPKGMSLEIFSCIQYIQQHTAEPIQVGDVVAHIGKSRTYLTAKFKEELGFDISSFIMRCKLEEAKSLLAYSDKSLSDIANYLCFSSQSYFQNVFKKKYGITPREYRLRNSRM